MPATGEDSVVSIPPQHSGLSSVARAVPGLSLVVAGFVLYAAQPVLKPLALAALLALILAPCAVFLENRGLPRALAAAATMIAALSGLAAVGVIVIYQLISLAADFRGYGEILQQRLSSLADSDSLFSRVADIARAGRETFAELISSRPAPVDVMVVTDPIEQLQATLSPYVAAIGTAAIVAIVATYFLVKRDDLSDRLVHLLGQDRIGITTRALDEAGTRISRYLSVFAGVNLFYGAAVAAGLALIGLPLAVLWGVLAGLLRFIPYVGAALGFIGPVLLTIAVFPGSQELIYVVLLFALLEAVLVGVAEPLVYGKSTGVSPIGLLVFALFWTWLWGPLGLLLSTPMTVSLAVAGRHVPGLAGISALLSIRPGLSPHLRLYQRLLANDLDAAKAMIDTARAGRLPGISFEALVLAAISKCRADDASGAITASERERVWRALDDLLDELEWSAGIALRTWAPTRELAEGSIVGVARDQADGLALRVLNLLLAPWRRDLVVMWLAAVRGHEALLAHTHPAVVVVFHVDAEQNAALRALTDALNGYAPDASVVSVGAVDPSGEAAGEQARVAVEAILVNVQTDDELTGRLTDALERETPHQLDGLLARIVRRRAADMFVLHVLEPALRTLATRASQSAAAAATEARAHAWLRQRLHEQLTAVRQSNPGALRAVIACPNATAEDLPLMSIGLALRARGWDILYLGNTVSWNSLPQILTTVLPDAVILAGEAEQVGCPGEKACTVFVVRSDGVADRQRADGAIQISAEIGAALGTIEERVRASKGAQTTDVRSV